MIITKDTLIAEILQKYPNTKNVFNKYNMGCMSCMGIKEETLEKGCLMHGIDVNEMLGELQKDVK